MTLMSPVVSCFLCLCFQFDVNRDGSPVGVASSTVNYSLMLEDIFGPLGTTGQGSWRGGKERERDEWRVGEGEDWEGGRGRGTKLWSWDLTCWIAKRPALFIFFLTKSNNNTCLKIPYICVCVSVCSRVCVRMYVSTFICLSACASECA